MEKLRSLNLMDFSILCFVIFISISFSHSDLAHTVLSSYSIQDGHILDFYEFNREVFVGHDYLFPTYLAFAIWMLPIRLLGLATDQNSFINLNLNMYELAWAKFGLLLLLFFAGKILHEIVSNQTNWTGYVNRQKVRRLFTYSPIALFAVTTMGQYDVIAIALILLGVKCWLLNKNKMFVLSFALAITFKYFAVLVLIPLVLIRFRKARQILFIFSVAIIPTVLMVALFLGSKAFRENVLNTPLRILGGSGSSQLLNASIKVTLTILILAMLHFLARKWISKGFSEFDVALNLIVIIFSLVFTFIRWNPQWLLYALPFWVMLQLREQKKQSLIWVEIFGFLGIAWMLANVWSNKLDQSMLITGPLSDLFQTHPLILLDFYRPEFLWLGVLIAQASILIPGIYVLFSRPNHEVKIHKLPTSLNSLELLKPLSFFFLYTLPIFMCILIPQDFANRISQQVISNSLNRSEANQFHSKLLVIEPGQSATQIMTFSKGDIRGIGLDVNASDKNGLHDIELTLSDIHGGKKLSLTQIPTRADNSFLGFTGWTEAIFLNYETIRTKDQLFQLTLINRSENDVKVWIDSVRPSRFKLVDANGKFISGSLVMATYF